MRLNLLERPRAALLVLAVALLATAGAFGLFEPTETRYAEIAREMRAGGDYLVPRLDGIPHFHKPPLTYWAIAAGFMALGENAWGARVPIALAAIATLALAARLARRRFASLAVPPGLAVWATGTSFLFLALARSVASDPILALSVAAFWGLAPSPWALVALSAGFLTKGPVVLVPTVLAILLAALWGRERTSLKLLGPARAWILFAALALPWYGLVMARTPGLLRHFLVNQLWDRYATHLHQRGGPPWYFVGVLLAGALPWTPALIGGLARLWRERARPEARLLMCWLLVPVAFLSLSGSKLPGYLLPCLPAVGLIAARGLEGRTRPVAWTGAALLAAIAACGWILGPAALGRAIGLAAPNRAALPMPAHVGLACLAYAATWLARARPAPAAFLVALGVTALTVALAPYDAPLGSPRAIARVVAENRVPGEPVIEFAHFNAGLPFYLREPVRLLEVPRETTFERLDRPAGMRLEADSLAALTAAHGRVWVLGPPRATAELAARVGLRYQGVTRWRHEALGFVTR